MARLCSQQQQQQLLQVCQQQQPRQHWRPRQLRELKVGKRL
jgi:hypothetical protein